MDTDVADTVKAPDFTLAHQTLDLDVDFSEQITGKTEITLYPNRKSVREVRLHSKQCHIQNVTVNGLKPQSIFYQEPCDRWRLHAHEAGVHQYHILQDKIGDGSDGDGELRISIPESLKIEHVNLTEVHTQNAGTIKISRPDAETPTEPTQALSDTSVAKFTPLTISIEFTSAHLRDGFHFVQGKPGNGRWPHAYTRGSLSEGAASCIFPCLDRLTARCTWDITIRSPRTVANALRQASPSHALDQLTLQDDSSSDSTNREMVILCSGEVTDELANKNDTTKKIVSFSVLQQLSARQLGFAVGPFQKVNLSVLRDAQDEEELGQNAVEMLGYCLPGRAEDVRNTCLPTTQAMDSIVRRYLTYPFNSYCMCFVEDSTQDTSIFAGLTICSTHMLYPSDVIDPAKDTARQLVHAITSQWIGVNIVAEEPRDSWVVVGIAHFMAELFMKELCGNNEYRFRMKQQSDLILELDKERPSLYDTGDLLHIDRSEYEFLRLKAPVVLFILDRRIAKAAGTSKMPGIISKILTRARIGDLPSNLISTDLFQRTCERFFHAKIDDFINQWVKGSGCPRFTVLQRFNKKKLVVEMSIKQIQGQAPPGQQVEQRELDTHSFMRDVREDFQEVYASPLQPVFTGSMTIRIHEADGTPYEHIVELKDSTTTFDIPYNTKYKRLKRSKKQKSRSTADAGDVDNEALLYCLGDVLQSEEEIRDWRVTEWSEEEENRMAAESYEWIRVDADFEWICRITLQQPGYMFVSQLQQDRDVVAQYESVKMVGLFGASPLISTIFLRTMVDRRYFHGIRSLAARALTRHAKKTPEVDNIGWYHLKKSFEELYCTTEHGIKVTRPNNFSDVLAYFLQGKIIEAMSQIRDEEGHAPREVKEFLLDKLKFNDNTSNEYSDAFYVSRLMKALCNAVVAKPRKAANVDAMDLDSIDEEQTHQKLEMDCLAEVDRYRRMDEWTGSYQNLYSRTALECLQMLNQAGIGQVTPLLFLQYTRPGNYDLLRITAYQVLVKLYCLDIASIMKYAMHCVVADASPLTRESIAVAFGEAFAAQAIGVAVDEMLTVQHQDGLVIEETDASDTRQKQLARRKNIDAAMEALEEALGDDKTLQLCLGNALKYPEIGLRDLRPLLDFCRLLYEAEDKLKVGLSYPRYWKVEHVGKGKLRFHQTGRVRTKRMPVWQPASIPGLMKPPKPSMKLTFKTSGNFSPNATPTPPPAPVSAPEPPKQGLKLKLNLGLKRDGQ